LRVVDTAWYCWSDVYHSAALVADESGSDEDFMVEDDDDSDYGRSKKKGKKVIRRGRPDKKEKKSPKPRLKATGSYKKTGLLVYGFSALMSIRSTSEQSSDMITSILG
ncbi:hypothetical protein XENOCAPTIV_001478, partial [Xenoophorus captivus]